MLFRCIKAERRKLMHSVILPASLIIPIIPTIMGTFNYLQNIEILTDGWYSLWTQLTLFYSSFFYAPLIALYCSYLWRLEHLNHNWYVFLTSPVSIPCLYLGKMAVVFVVTLITQLWVGVLYIIAGKFVGFSGLCPPQIVFWLLRGTLAAIAIGALQLLLSMLIRSFSIPIGIALVGSVFGMLFSNRGVGLFWPYSLMLLGMNSNKSADSLAGSSMIFLLAVVVFFFLFYQIAIRSLKTKDR
ncbi:MAG: ABC transporter permease [Lachnospiraceae bacterium]|nr:ABC transporter permease [Lachnospiraceae bacterium]